MKQMRTMMYTAGFGGLLASVVAVGPAAMAAAPVATSQVTSVTKAPANLAPSSDAALKAQHPLMRQTLLRGSRGHWVMTLQANLRALGYPSVGPEDGIFGPFTQRALEAFQSAHGLKPSGVTTFATWEAMLRAFHLIPADASLMTNHSAMAQVLKSGSRGHWVATLQADLALAGFSQVGAADGKFGPKTRSAVIAFQGQQHLPATGVTNPATWQALLTRLGVLGPASTSATTTTHTAPAPKLSANVNQVNAASHPATIDGYRVVGVYHMRATAYGPSLKDNYPYGPVDAFGQPLKSGMVAVDPRVIPLKTRVYVAGYTDRRLPHGGFLGRAMDTGGAIKGQRIDIFMNANSQTVSNFGIEPVTVYTLAKP